MQQISLIPGDYGEVLGEHCFYHYPSCLAGEHWHQGNPWAEKLMDLVTHKIIGDDSDREAAIRFINNHKQAFEISNQIISDDQIIIEKYLYLPEFSNQIHDIPLPTLYAVEIHHPKNDSDKKPYEVHFAIRPYAFPSRSLVLKTGNLASFLENKLTLVNFLQPAEPPRNITITNTSYIHNILELTNGLLACTCRYKVCIFNPHHPEVTLENTFFVPALRNDVFCRSYLISNTLMLTTPTCWDNQNSFIWDLSDLMESHHPEDSVNKPDRHPADHEASSEQRRPCDSSFENPPIQHRSSLTSLETCHWTSLRMPGIPGVAATPQKRTPVATIRLPILRHEEIEYIYSGKAVMEYSDNEAYVEKICILDFFSDPLLTAKQSNN